MKKEKIKLEKLKVKSFVTTLEAQHKKTLHGAASIGAACAHTSWDTYPIDDAIILDWYEVTYHILPAYTEAASCTCPPPTVGCPSQEGFLCTAGKVLGGAARAAAYVQTTITMTIGSGGLQLGSNQCGSDGCMA